MTRVSTIPAATGAAIALVIGALTVPAVADTAPLVYVDAVDGDDASPGTAPDEPVRTLAQAVATVASDGGRVVLMGDYALEESFTEPEHADAEILITSTDGEETYPGRLVFGDEENLAYHLNGPTTFADLTVETSHPAVFAANFNPIVFDDGVEMENAAGTGPQVSVVGGHYAPKAEVPTDLDSDVRINSGSFYRVVGFSQERGDATQTYAGTSHISLHGGTVEDIFGASVQNHYSGSTVISMTGGEVGTLHTGGDATRYLVGSAEVSLTGGNVNLVDLNNVVEDVDLTLDGATFADIQATNTFASIERDEDIQKFAATRTVRYAGQHYTAEQVDRLTELFDETINIAQLYVHPDGSGQACSESDPCASLEAAVDLLTADGGTINVTGTVPWDVSTEALAAGNGRLVFTGAEGAALAFPAGAVVTSERDLTLATLTLSNAGALELQADGADLVLGHGTQVADGSEVSVVGVSDGSALTIADGEFAHVIGVTGLDGDFAGSTDVTVSGGAVDELWAGTDDSFDVAATVTTIAGGDVGTVHSSAGRTNDSMAVRFLGGTVGSAELDGADADVSVRIGAAEIGAISVGDWANAPDASRVLTQLPDADQGAIDEIAPAFDDLVEDQFVYVAGGAENGDGASPTSPLGDLNEAVRALDGPGRIVLVDELTVADAVDLEEHTGRIVISADDGDVDYADRGAALGVEAPLRSGGELVLQHLPLHSPAMDGAIYGMGHPLTIGAGVDTELTRRGQTYLRLVGGRDDEQAAPSIDLSVTGGQWAGLQAGSDSAEAVTTGIETSVQINGGTFNGPVVLGHRGEGSGSIEAQLAGGTFLQGVYAVYEEDGEPYQADYDVDLTVTDGEYWGMIAPAKSTGTTVDGTFHVLLEGGDFGHLTDIRGTESFAGTMTSSIDVDPSVDLEAAPGGEVTFTNYLTRAADPYMFTHDGQYYFLATSGSTMKLHKVANPADLSHSEGSTIFAPDDLKDLWSPEVHHFTADEVGEENAGWYLYLSATNPDDPRSEGQRQYVLKALDGDDLLGRWGNPVTGEVGVPERITNSDNPDFNTDDFVAGTSVLRVGGETHILYVAEVGRDTEDFHQTINLSHMDNPWTLSGEPSVIVEPTYEWEEHGYGYTDKWRPKVVEGATAVYGDDDEIYLAYSGSGYWTPQYSIGYMRFTGGDPFDADNWVKNPSPILSRSDTVNGIGTGPPFTDHEGNDWFTYQARTGTTTVSGRFAFIEPYQASGETLAIGDGSGHPAPMETEYTMSVNPVPLADKISGFESADDERPEAVLVEPTSAGPMQELSLQLDASDPGGLDRIVANVYADGDLVESTQTRVDGEVAGSHTATVALADGDYTIRYNAHDLAGNVSDTGAFDVTVDGTAPTVTVKEGQEFTTESDDGSYDRVSFKLYDAGQIDRAVLNGTVIDLSTDVWSDLNFLEPGTSGAVAGENTLIVYDVAGNSQTVVFTLSSQR